MKAKLFTRHLTTKWFGYGFGVALTVGLGFLLTYTARLLERVSYDVPFVLRGDHRLPRELVLVYIDAHVKESLNQPTDQPLDRSFYARVLERLTRDRARLVLIDILFDQPSADPSVDAQLAARMREHGRVVLVAESVKELYQNAVTDTTVPPIAIFQEAAAGYGLANVKTDPDFSIRRIDLKMGTTPSAGLVAARLLRGGTVPVRGAPWLNYYCAPAHLQSVTLDSVVRDELDRDYFRDKIVVIGTKPEGRVAGADREEFGNPYSEFGGAPSSGAAVHGLTLLNLTRGDFLTRLSTRQELLIAGSWGVVICLVLMRLNPWVAILVALFAGTAFTATAVWLQLRNNIWFAWAIPAGVESGIALVWAVGYQYLVASAKRQRLRRAFAAYLSPYMADRIAESEYDLAPGGKEVEATIMFTDLQGFTQLSETLRPTELSRILIAYFNQTTRGILDQDGTVIKFIGDAVLAAWGAPLPEPKPEERAVLAALAIREATVRQIEGHFLRTRIGINTGTVLAGHLGSDTRMEYTVVGDAINLGHRIEQLNKHLGTVILVSEQTRSRLSDQIAVRRLGRFVLPGKTSAVAVWEVLGKRNAGAASPEWAAVFAAALDQFEKGQLTEANELFAKVIAQREGKDGPSEFYCSYIAQLPTVQLPAWDGVVRLDEK